MTDAISMQTQAAMLGARRQPVMNQTADADAARKTAQDFEAFFLGQMLQPMFANISAEDPFGGGAGEDMWRQLQVDEYGKALAKNGGIGIADSVFREMLKMQEVQ